MSDECKGKQRNVWEELDTFLEVVRGTICYLSSPRVTQSIFSGNLGGFYVEEISKECFEKKGVTCKIFQHQGGGAGSIYAYYKCSLGKVWERKITQRSEVTFLFPPWEFKKKSWECLNMHSSEFIPWELRSNFTLYDISHNASSDLPSHLGLDSKKTSEGVTGMVQCNSLSMDGTSQQYYSLSLSLF